MVKGRTSIRMQEQIKILRAQGLSIRKIAQALGMCRQTVRKYLESAPKVQEVVVITEDQRLAGIDWEYVSQEISSKGCSIKQLHRELGGEVSYVDFWRAFRAQVPSTKEVVIRQQHKPGEKVHIDFCDGIDIVDRETGKKSKTELFVGVLAFSSNTFGEFVLDQKTPTFLCVQERMFHDFGGVPRYAVPDNLKSGVSKAHRYDPDVNPTYCDFANHYNFAVLPARPYKPRDKASVESGIGVIQRSFFHEVRNRVFYSLAALNLALREFLERLNHEVMKDYGVSRATRFATERPLLQALPATRFMLSEWRHAKVHPDCHVQVLKNFYSVPYGHVGQTVRARISEKMVEVYNAESASIAVHMRVYGQGQYSTLDSHYPVAKVAVARFEIHHAKEAATKLGPHVAQVVDELLSGTHPLRYLRRVQGLLRLGKSFSHEALNYGCAQAKAFRKMRLQFIRDCAQHYEEHGNRPRLVTPPRDVNTLHLRAIAVPGKVVDHA